MKIEKECYGCKQKILLDEKELRSLNKRELKNLRWRKEAIKKIGDEEVVTDSLLSWFLPLPKGVFGIKKRRREISEFKRLEEIANIHKKFVCPVCNTTNYI